MRKVQRTASASLPPVAEVVPAATSTVYSVAMGKRKEGWKTRVRVPSHFHEPSGWGVSLTGTSFAARSAWDVSGTIAWSKVMLRKGAWSTAPSGL